MTFDQALSIAYPDRFPPPTEAEPEPWATCEACGGDIYPGEDILELQDGTIVHDDMDCLRKCTGAVAKEAG